MVIERRPFFRHCHFLKSQDELMPENGQGNYVKWSSQAIGQQ